MHQDSSLTEDIWKLKIGDSSGAFVFSIKDLTVLKGFSEINKAHSENCFGDESICITDLAHTTYPLCIECSGQNSIISNGE